MDKSTDWELVDIVDMLPYANRPLWETARFIAYIDAKSHFKNIGEMKDFLSLKWEDEENPDLVEHNYDISNDDIERLKKLSALSQDDFNKMKYGDNSVEKKSPDLLQKLILQK